MHRESGVTLIEILTIAVALVVIIAVAIPLWRTHELRAQRARAIQVLRSVQAAQDRYFGAHARYADVTQLGVAARGAATMVSKCGLAPDQLAYVATASAWRNAIAGTVDARCSRMSIDQHGRRSATDSSGEDSTGDCWDRK